MGRLLSAQLRWLLGQEGLHIKSLTLRTPTLDDVFMEMTGSRIEKEEVRS